ncbi:MAG: ribose-phosphate pyrophosphokinase [bacterium]|nr:ribose-phosphate pyrophosphokinase [bacterium]
MEEIRESRFVLLSSPLMHEFGDKLVKHLEKCGMHIPQYQIEFTTFANSEVLPHIPHTIRGQHVFFLHALQHPDPNTAVMMMLIANDAIKRAAALGITLVTPYLPYMRQDRKDRPRVPISARMLADLIESNHLVKGLITIDMHAEQEQGFFSIPVDNLTGVKVFSEYIREKFNGDLANVVVMAPDFGGAVRNRRLARALEDLPVCILEKRRIGPNKAEMLYVIGESIEGKRVIMYEDMIDTGGTAIEAIEKVIAMGAREVYLCATHAIFSRNAENRFGEKGIAVACTNSIPRSRDYYQHCPWLTPVSIISYFADAIFQAAQIGGSISKLSDRDGQKA